MHVTEINTIRQNLEKYKKQAENQEMMIKKLQEQKKQVEENWKTLKTAATGLKLVNISTTVSVRS